VGVFNVYFEAHYSEVTTSTGYDCLDFTWLRVLMECFDITGGSGLHALQDVKD